MVQLISSLLSEGKKIFAVVGRNHVPMQADALACEWGKLISISNDGNWTPILYLIGWYIQARCVEFSQ